MITLSEFLFVAAIVTVLSLGMGALMYVVDSRFQRKERGEE